MKLTISEFIQNKTDEELKQLKILIDMELRSRNLVRSSNLQQSMNTILRIQMKYSNTLAGPSVPINGVQKPAFSALSRAYYHLLDQYTELHNEIA